MEKKTCDKCGKEFKAFKPEFTTCPKCNKGETPSPQGGKTMRDNRRPQDRRDNRGGNRGGYQHNQSANLLQDLKLDSFYTENGAIKRNIYVETSENIANQFNREGLSASSVRRFFEVVRNAYETQQQDPDRAYDKILEPIYALRPAARYSQERQVTKQCFTDFINHYIDVAAQDEKNLKGFKELFMSVIGYMKDKRR